MTGVRAGLLCIALVAAASAAHAQQPSDQQAADPVQEAIQKVAASARRAKQQNQTPNVALDLDYLVTLQHNSRLVQLLQDFEEERADEQIGATSSSSGTTTVTSKGTVPEILALAVENGAVTQSQSGTVLTFRTNVGGAIRMLAAKRFLQLHGGPDPGLDLLARVALSASFDTSRGSDVAGTTTFTGDQQQLSQWTFRALLVNHRDPGRHAFVQKWRTLVLPSQLNLTQAAGALDQQLQKDDAFLKWATDTNQALAAADDSAIESVLRAAGAKFPIKELSPATRAAFARFDQLSAAFEEKRRTPLHDLENGALVTFEYTNDRPVTGPKLSNVRLIGTLGGTVDLTGNASLTLFDQIPAGASKRVRDVQVAGALDARLGSADTIPFTLSFSGKYVYQYEDTFDDATGARLADTAGSRWALQAKLTLPAMKGTGMRIPIALTVANIPEADPADRSKKIVRANVGVTYDLDALFARFKP